MYTVMTKRVVASAVLLTVLVVALASIVWADTTIGDPSVTKFTEIKSSDVSYTGGTGISIPLYTLPGRNGLDFPIMLSYSPGIRTHQEAGPVGLGFSLVAGSVQRGVQGFADDKKDQGEVYLNIGKFGACVDSLTSGAVMGTNPGSCGGWTPVSECYVKGAETAQEAFNSYGNSIKHFCKKPACVYENA